MTIKWDADIVNHNIYATGVKKDDTVTVTEHVSNNLIRSAGLTTDACPVLAQSIWSDEFQFTHVDTEVFHECASVASCAPT
jgi:hypothetical protein